MSVFSWNNIFGNSNSDVADSELPDIFPLLLASADFVKSDILSTFTKILTDTMARTHGLAEKQEPLLWDNCVQSEANQGLISLLACAMADKKDLFLVYKPSLNILRKATTQEEQQIRKDYETKGESTVGVFISFKNYRRSEMLQVYSQLEYCVLASLHKTVNISKAIQIGISDLRASVSLADSSIAREQARSIAKALAKGKDVFLDVKDKITTAVPDMGPTKEAIAFLDAKRAYLLDLPISYVTGMQTGGMDNSGGGDAKAVERGLKQYFVSIIQPVLKVVFGVDTEFKSEDFDGMGSALEALKTFELTGNEVISSVAKQDIAQRLFDLDPEEEEKNLAEDAKQAEADAKKNLPPVVDPNAPPPKPGQQPQPPQGSAK